MFLLWRDSMYYFSEWEHCILLARTKEEALLKSGLEGADTQTLPLVEAGYFSFERDFLARGRHYLTEITLDTQVLYLLQFAEYRSDKVHIFFHTDPAVMEAELEVWRKESNEFATMDEGIHFIKTADGRCFDCYELKLKVDDDVI